MVTQVERSTWQSPFGPGELMQSPNYRVFSTTRNAALQQYLPGFMEAAYTHYLNLTGLDRNNHIDLLELYVLATRRQWAHLTQHRLGERSDVYLQLEAGGYMVDGVCVLWDIGVTGTLSVAAHEGLHQFLHHRLKHRVPMWAEEGLCTTAEGFELDRDTVRFTPAGNASRYNSLHNVLAQDYWIPLERLLPMDAGDAVGQHQGRAVGYYAQVWSLILFIQSDPATRAGFQRMLRDASAGQLVQNLGLSVSQFPSMRGRRYNRAISTPVFRAYISDDLETFEREWLAFARKLVRFDR